MNRCILDLRGLALHAYYSGTPDSVVLNANGDKVPSAGHGINAFIDIYLKPLLQRWNPIEMIAVLEGQDGNARRRAIVADYKSKKEQDADDETVRQEKAGCFNGIRSLLLHLGATVVSTPYAEADDTIAHLCERLPGNHEVYTVDQDLLAVWRRNVKVFISDRRQGGIGERTQFKGIDVEEDSPRLITLYKSLVGDTSDNIKGVPGFGEAKFKTLWQKYGMDGLLQLADIVDSADWPLLEAAQDGSKELALIAANREVWRASWRVASLHPEWCEQNWGTKPVSMKWQKRVPLKENILRVLTDNHLEDRIDEFANYWVDRGIVDAPAWEAMRSTGAWADTLREMKNSHVVAFDYETYDTLQNEGYKKAGKGKYVDVLNSEPTGASFCYGNNLQNCFYMPTNHRDTLNCGLEDLTFLLRATEGVERVAHNCSFEATVSARYLGYQFPLSNLPHDTAVLCSYADENEEAGLKKLSKAWLNYDQTTYSQVVGAGQDMRDVSAKEVMDYGCDDSIVTAHLYLLFQTIAQCEQTWDFYERNERYFAAAHVPSFIKGVRVDFDQLSALEAEDAKLFEDSEAKLRTVLAERCQEVNEEGYKSLVQELQDYTEATYRANCAKKGTTPDLDEIEKRRKTTANQLWEGCKYAPYTPPTMDNFRACLSDALKAVGLPFVRSVKRDSLTKWTTGVLEQGVELSDEAVPLFSAVQEFADSGDDERLVLLVQQHLKTGKSLWVGTELNVGSPKQMAFLLYGMLGLPILVRNIADEDSARDQFDMEGAPATNDLAINTWKVHLKEDDWRIEVLELLQTMKLCRQRQSLYYTPWPLWRSPVDGNIHPQFRNCGTITRRPSGSSPNLLQVSKHKDEGRIRSCILPLTDDEVVVSIDWAQQEIRIEAAVSGDKNLLACYTGENRLDVHSMMAVEIANVLRRRKGKRAWTYQEYEAIRGDKSHEDQAWADNVRSKMAKATVFAILYGGGPKGIALKLSIPEDLAKEFYEGFFRAYPGVRARQEAVTAFARKYGWSKTMYGNRKHAPLILSKDNAKVAMTERQVMNMEMQGTAADICKMTCREWLERDLPGRFGATLYAFVYDEVTASVPKKHVKDYVEALMDIMQVTLPGTDIVLEAEASVGDSWGRQVSLEKWLQENNNG